MSFQSHRLTAVSAIVLSAVLQTMASAADAPETTADDTIIVTGTRESGHRAIDSAAPIEVITPEALQATGQANVFDALKTILPSFSSSTANYDTGALVRSARLRGLSPNEVLVLVNGKRRHTTANVNADQGPDIASNPVDLDLIPLSLIDHIEVLEEGAAAQYGSDAIAGVLNIILKNSASAKDAYVTGGITTKGDGTQAAAGTNAGFALGSDGFLDVSLDYRHHDASNRSGLDPRTSVTYAGEPAFTTRGRQIGDPDSDLLNTGFNLEKPLTDTITAYGFGSFGYRKAYAFENVRTYTTAPTVYPSGFAPQETLEEYDYSVTGGVKGKLAAWDWDLSTTYGWDHDSIGVINTVNTGTLPGTSIAPFLNTSESVHAGNEINSQLTTNLDVRRGFDLGFAQPLTVATGFEHRYETYKIEQGDPESYLYGGTQSYSGFTPTDASSLSRNSEAFYVDLSTKITAPWQVDIAGRFENYDQTGTTETGKFTTRYDIVPQFALRGTVSDGFHAPTLAQEGFSTTNITPSSASGAAATAQAYGLQLPVESPAARSLGAPSLKPEESKDLSFGFVAEPFSRAHLSVDAYQIFIANRIINTPVYGGSTSASATPASLAADVNNQAALAAAASNGISIPDVAGNVTQVSFFTNGVNTRTRGLDISADYRSDFGAAGAVDWFANGNFNRTNITKFNALPAKLVAAGLSYQSAPNVVNDLTNASPAAKVAFGGTYFLGDLDLTLRETFYGHVVEVDNTSAGYIWSEIPAAFITDLDVGYRVTEHVKVDIGANNLFDKYPPENFGYRAVAALGKRATEYYSTYTPYGIDGAYYYVRIAASF